MSLVAGSYERFIWGYRLKTRETISLIPLFSFPSHLSTIKAVAVAGSAAVSGGNDDTIKIYDLTTCSEIGGLHQASAVTSLSFFTPPSLSFPRNLVSADSQGSLSIYDTDPFVHLKTIKIHKKGINSLSIHPSGKLALTVGHDECLAMVNLVRGRRSFYCRLNKESTIVQFNEVGEKFFMVVDEKITVHEAEDAKQVFELNNGKRVLCLEPGSNGILFTGGEEKSIKAWDTVSGKVAYTIDNAHAARIKGIVVLSKSCENACENDPYVVASGSSDGVIRAWDVRMVNLGKPNPIAEVNTNSRLTCLAGSSIKSTRKPQTENDEQ